MDYDYLIVGCGLAGLYFSRILTENDKNFIIYDNNSQNSSIVAAGAYNPISLKRYSSVWNASEQLSNLQKFYDEIEQDFDSTFNTKIKSYKFFSSIQDQNNWTTASDKPIISNYIQSSVVHKPIKGLTSEFGYGIYEGTGWIDIKGLLKNYKKNLASKQCIIKETFDYKLLQIKEDHVTYGTNNFCYIIFAEGFGIKQNPYFNYLPLGGTKGEVLVIKSPELLIDFQLKSSIFILPIGNDLYKVGATYDRFDKTQTTTKEAKEELLTKLDKIITVPYEVVEHYAGIRPSVKDRKPLVGIHPTYPKLAVLNGFGSRGVMIGATVSRQLYDFLENGVPLDKVIDCKRYS